MKANSCQVPTVFFQKRFLIFVLFSMALCQAGCGGGSGGSEESPSAASYYLKASNTDAGDLFGHGVALSGDTLVVAAQKESSAATGVNGDQSDNSAGESGAVYVFRRGSGGVWSQEAYLKASNTDAADWFGWSVAVYGDTLVVGAYREDSNATEIDGDQGNSDPGYYGAAYVFIRDTGGNWSQQAYLKASNAEAMDQFGYSVAIWEDTIVVGARYESGDGSSQDNNDDSSSGAAYVFARENGSWSQQAYLKASNTDNADLFGTSVAVCEDTIVVGAIWEDGDGSSETNNDVSSSGAAYIFTRESGLWSQEAYLKAAEPGADDRFGWSAAIYGDTVVVGALREDSNASGVNGNESNNSATESGAAYVFTRDNGQWSQEAYLKASDAASYNYFGVSVAAHDNRIVVGASGKDNDTGKAYSFARDNGTWRQEDCFEATNKDSGDLFGFSVALSEGWIAVGAKEEDSSATGVDGDATDNSAVDSGAAYLF